MGLFDFLKAKSEDTEKFVTDSRFQVNLAKQLQMTPMTLEQLRNHNVTEDKELKLEYFFYTNSNDKAKTFAEELAKLNYEIKYGKSAGDKKLFIVTGWTAKVQMSETVILNWTKEMCDLGYKFDCDFDGWGTSLDQ